VKDFFFNRKVNLALDDVHPVPKLSAAQPTLQVAPPLQVGITDPNAPA